MTGEAPGFEVAAIVAEGTKEDEARTEGGIAGEAGREVEGIGVAEATGEEKVKADEATKEVGTAAAATAAEGTAAVEAIGAEGTGEEETVQQGPAAVVKMEAA